MWHVFILLTIFATVRESDATWCVCRSDLNDTVLQNTIDYACGHGADCTQILQNGTCYNPNTVKPHCSYAASSYYQRNNGDKAACDFGGTAVITSIDPSTSGCTYPASTIAPNANNTTGFGPSRAPDNTNSGFQTEARSIIWTLCFPFMQSC